MTRLRVFLKAFNAGDRGQDLAEYCLLTALVALIAAGIMIHVSGGMQAVWGGANTSLAAGNQAVQAGAGTADTTTSRGDR
jgi:Flp pilus assembly pilin Flp